ncbi:hypothetical protein QJQ45_021285 [Haematococcus lacustris]|nr:hypothetical protein QJQ45_021285 [Haematococcus lacustris]
MQLRFDYLAESAFGSDVAILTSPEQRRLAVQQCTLNFPNSTGVGIDWQVAAEALAEELKQSGCSDNVLEMAMARLQQTQARVALHVEKWLAVAEVCLTSSNFVAAADPGQHTGPRAPSELPQSSPSTSSAELSFSVGGRNPLPARPSLVSAQAMQCGHGSSPGAAEQLDTEDEQPGAPRHKRARQEDWDDSNKQQAAGQQQSSNPAAHEGATSDTQHLPPTEQQLGSCPRTPPCSSSVHDQSPHTRLAVQQQQGQQEQQEQDELDEQQACQRHQEVKEEVHEGSPEEQSEELQLLPAAWTPIASASPQLPSPAASPPPPEAGRMLPPGPIEPSSPPDLPDCPLQLQAAVAVKQEEEEEQEKGCGYASLPADLAPHSHPALQPSSEANASTAPPPAQAGHQGDPLQPESAPLVNAGAGPLPSLPPSPPPLQAPGGDPPLACPPVHTSLPGPGALHGTAGLQPCASHQGEWPARGEGGLPGLMARSPQGQQGQSGRGSSEEPPMVEGLEDRACSNPSVLADLTHVIDAGRGEMAAAAGARTEASSAKQRVGGPTASPASQLGPCTSLGSVACAAAGSQGAAAPPAMASAASGMSAAAPALPTSLPSAQAACAPVMPPATPAAQPARLPSADAGVLDFLTSFCGPEQQSGQVAGQVAMVPELLPLLYVPQPLTLLLWQLQAALLQHGSSTSSSGRSETVETAGSGQGPGAGPRTKAVEGPGALSNNPPCLPGGAVMSGSLVLVRMDGLVRLRQVLRLSSDPLALQQAHSRPGASPYPPALTQPQLHPPPCQPAAATPATLAGAAAAGKAGLEQSVVQAGLAVGAEFALELEGCGWWPVGLVLAMPLEQLPADTVRDLCCEFSWAVERGLVQALRRTQVLEATHQLRRHLHAWLRVGMAGAEDGREGRGEGRGEAGRQGERVWQAVQQQLAEPWGRDVEEAVQQLPDHAWPMRQAAVLHWCARLGDTPLPGLQPKLEAQVDTAPASGAGATACLPAAASQAGPQRLAPALLPSSSSLLLSQGNGHHARPPTHSLPPDGSGCVWPASTVAQSTCPGSADADMGDDDDEPDPELLQLAEKVQAALKKASAAKAAAAAAQSVPPPSPASRDAPVAVPGALRPLPSAADAGVKRAGEAAAGSDELALQKRARVGPLLGGSGGQGAALTQLPAAALPTQQVPHGPGSQPPELPGKQGHLKAMMAAVATAHSTAGGPLRVLTTHPGQAPAADHDSPPPRLAAGQQAIEPAPPGQGPRQMRVSPPLAAKDELAAAVSQQAVVDSLWPGTTATVSAETYTARRRLSHQPALPTVGQLEQFSSAQELMLAHARAAGARALSEASVPVQAEASHVRSAASTGPTATPLASVKLLPLPSVQLERPFRCGSPGSQLRSSQRQAELSNEIRGSTPWSTSSGNRTHGPGYASNWRGGSENQQSHDHGPSRDHDQGREGGDWDEGSKAPQDQQRGRDGYGGLRHESEGRNLANRPGDQQRGGGYQQHSKRSYEHHLRTLKAMSADERYEVLAAVFGNDDVRARLRQVAAYLLIDAAPLFVKSASQSRRNALYMHWLGLAMARADPPLWYEFKSFDPPIPLTRLFDGDPPGVFSVFTQYGEQPVVQLNIEHLPHHHQLVSATDVNKDGGQEGDESEDGLLFSEQELNDYKCGGDSSIERWIRSFEVKLISFLQTQPNYRASLQDMSRAVRIPKSVLVECKDFHGFITRSKLFWRTPGHVELAKPQVIRNVLRN